MAQERPAAIIEEYSDTSSAFVEVRFNSAVVVCTLCSLLTNCLQAVDEHQVRHNEITASKDDLASLAQATDRVVSRGLMAEVCLTVCSSLHGAAAALTLGP